MRGGKTIKKRSESKQGRPTRPTKERRRGDGGQSAKRTPPHSQRVDKASPSEADERTLKEAAGLFLSGLDSSSSTARGAAPRAPPLSKAKVQTTKKRGRGEGVAGSGTVGSRTPSTPPREKKRQKGSGAFFVPLEEGGDAEDEAVSRQVLARTAAFLSGLSSTKKDSFWALRSAAAGNNDGSNAQATQKGKKGKTHTHGKDIASGEEGWWDEASGVDSEAHSDSDSGSSSEPSWIPESDDDEFFSKRESTDGKVSDATKAQRREGQRSPRSDSSDDEEDGDDDESDGVWSDDD